MDKTPQRIMTWTITKAATEFGTTRETLKRRLHAAGVEVKPGRTFTTRQIFAALAGDLRFERTRRERAEADKAERENRVAESRLVDISEVDQIIWHDFLAPLRHELLELPQQVARLCNPADPATAEQVLETHIAAIHARILAGKREADQRAAGQPKAEQ